MAILSDSLTTQHQDQSLKIDLEAEIYIGHVLNDSALDFSGPGTHCDSAQGTRPVKITQTE